MFYHKFIQEYIELGHISVSPETLKTSEDRKSCFLPHHGVLKVIDPKEQVRVVFNASVRLQDGLPLNECLHVEAAK